MDLRLEQLGSQRAGLSRELQDRVNRTPWTENRLHYVVLKDLDQVAIILFDLVDVSDSAPGKTLVLYELWVAQDYRRQGIGSTLLKCADWIASSRGYTQILVRPEALSADMSTEELTKWYRERGFKECGDQPDVLCKEVNGTVSE
jgi:GNAT superfamily N-acetyltransferase